MESLAVLDSGRALLIGPYPPGLSRRVRYRGFHHWFTLCYTVPSCLSDLDHLIVLAYPVFVRAAPTLSCASKIRLPSASAVCCDKPLADSLILLDYSAPRGAQYRQPKNKRSASR